MFFKKLNLFLYPVLAIVLYFAIPFYNHWLYKKILNNNFITELTHLSARDRNVTRFGYSYTVYEDIQNTIPDKENALLLLPSNEYLQSRSVNELSIPEAAVFYYFTGIRSVQANSPDAAKANWVVFVTGPDSMFVKQMRYFAHPDSLIAFYKKYTH